MRGTLIYSLLLLCGFLLPLESPWWLGLRVMTDLFVMVFFGVLLVPGLRALLQKGLLTGPIIKVSIVLALWVIPMGVNIGSLYWHTSINYAFLHDCSTQMSYLKKANPDPTLLKMIRHEMRQRWEAVSSFRGNLLRSMTFFFLVPEPRVLDFEKYLTQADQDENEVLALFGNTVFSWVLLLVSLGVSGFLLSLVPEKHSAS